MRSLIRFGDYPFGLLRFGDFMSDFKGRMYEMLEHFPSKYSFAPVTTEETDTHYSLKIPLAGVGKDKIDVSLEGSMLTVKASDSHEDEESGKSSMNYSGQWGLPTGHGEITSKYEDGMLEILIEKPEEETPEVTEIPIE